MFKRVGIAVLAAAMFAGSGIFVAPRPAQADTLSTIATAAAAILGSLVFDQFNRPYYVQNGERCYVPDDVADYYFRTRYAGWYTNHRRDWYDNRAAFIQDWNRDYGYRNYGYNGYNRGYSNVRVYPYPVYNRTNYSPGYNRGNYNPGYNRTIYSPAYNRPRYNRTNDRRWKDNGNSQDRDNADRDNRSNWDNRGNDHHGRGNHRGR